MLIYKKKLINFFYNFSLLYIKTPKSLSPKCYQENKESTQKRLVKDIKIFVKKKKKKKQQYGHERYKNLSEGEKINWLSIEKKFQSFYNYKKGFEFKKLSLL